MFKINLKDLTLSSDIDYSELIKATEGYSGSDLANVCREASFMQMRRRLLNNNQDFMNLVQMTNFKSQLDAPISQNDLLTAISNICKSVSSNDLEKYIQWSNEFKSS
jgi:katanin p60 ATPase-containing subunit A1